MNWRAGHCDGRWTCFRHCDYACTSRCDDDVVVLMFDASKDKKLYDAHTKLDSLFRFFQNQKTELQHLHPAYLDRRSQKKTKTGELKPWTGS